MALVVVSMGAGMSHAEVVTIDSVSGAGPTYTVNFLAAAPSAIVVGDMLKDQSSGHRMLIESIAGDRLSFVVRDAYGDGAPSTGLADITRFYSGTTPYAAFHGDLDNATLYGAGDQVIAERWNDGDFNETITFSNGGTVGLALIALAVADGERHSGVANTGVRLLRSGSGGIRWNLPAGIIGADQDAEFDGGGFQTQDGATQISGDTTVVRRNIIHNLEHPNAVIGVGQAFAGNFGGHQVLNNFLYGIKSTGSGSFSYARGITTRSDFSRTIRVANNTVFGMEASDVSNNQDASAFYATRDSANLEIKNNLFLGSVNAGVGAADDFRFLGTAADSLNNFSSDNTADDAGGTGHLTGLVPADELTNIAEGSENLHLKSGATVIGQALTLTMDQVEFDIDFESRDGLTWDGGADQLVPDGIAFSSTASGQVDSGADLGLTLAFGSTAAGQVDGSADLGVLVVFGSTAGGQVDGSADLEVVVDFSSTAAGAVDASADLGVLVDFSSTSAGIVDCSADLGVLIDFGSTTAGVVDASADLTVLGTITFSSTADGQVDASADLGVLVDFGSTAAGVADASADLTIAGALTFNSTADGQVDASADLGVQVAFGSTAGGVVDASADLGVLVDFGSTAAAVVDASADLGVLIDFGSTTDGVVDARADLQGISQKSFRSTADGRVDASAEMIASLAFVSTAAAQVDAQADLALSLMFDSTAAGQVDASADLGVQIDFGSTAIAQVDALADLDVHVAFGSTADGRVDASADLGALVAFGSTAAAQADAQADLTLSLRFGSMTEAFVDASANLGIEGLILFESVASGIVMCSAALAEVKSPSRVTVSRIGPYQASVSKIGPCRASIVKPGPRKVSIGV